MVLGGSYHEGKPLKFSSSRLKNDGWKLEDKPFLLGWIHFQGRTAIKVPGSNWWPLAHVVIENFVQKILVGVGLDSGPKWR